MDDQAFPKLLRKNAISFGNKIAMQEKDKGIWSPKTWGEVYTEVEELSLGLITLGFQKGDMACLIGDNRPEYWIGQMAVMSIGGIPVGIFQDSLEEEIEYLLNYGDIKFAIVEDQEQVDKLLNIKKDTDLDYIIVDDWKGLASYDETSLIKYRDVLKKGRKSRGENPDLFDELVNQTHEDDIALMSTSSGTTGKPKGIMLSYKDCLEMAKCFEEAVPISQSTEVITYLPLAWIVEQMVSVCWFLRNRFTINFPEEPETVRENIREVGPDLIIAPPRIWESMCSEVQVKILDSSFFKRIIFKACSPYGYKLIEKKFGREKMSLPWKIVDFITDFLAFGPLRDKLGFSRVKFAFTGGASLGPEVFRFFQAIGVNLLQMYGQTESGGIVCTHRLRDVRYETVGRPIPGVELKISDTGEILIKSPGLFQRYHKMPEETSSVITDGWFYSGDCGIIENGHLIMIDRMQDVMQLVDGTKYSPSLLENKLKFSPYIREAIVFGQDRPHIIALIQIDYPNVGHWSEKRRIEYTTFAGLAKNEKVYELIDQEVKKVNENLPSAARIKRLFLLKKELDADDDELTRTQKIRRKFVGERYRELVESIYNDGR